MAGLLVPGYKAGAAGVAMIQLKLFLTGTGTKYNWTDPGDGTKARWDVTGLISVGPVEIGNGYGKPLGKGGLSLVSKEDHEALVNALLELSNEAQTDLGNKAINARELLKPHLAADKVEFVN